MASDALDRFRKSMDIGYEEWHDGTGYDLEAIDQLADDEKKIAEQMLVPRADRDWRDLEALDHLGTPRAIQAILEARRASDPQIRLKAHEYGPEPTAAEWEVAILNLLKTAEIYTGLTSALNCAIDHPSPTVEAMLWDKIRDPESGVAYHCAATLCVLHGVLDSIYNDRHRKLFLRLVEKDSDGPQAGSRGANETG